MASESPNQRVEQRGSLRRSLNLDGMFSIDSELKSLCVVQDYCDTGICISLSGVDSNFDKIRAACEDSPCDRTFVLEFGHQAELIKIPCIFVRLFSQGVGVKFANKDSREVEILREIATSYPQNTNNRNPARIAKKDHLSAFKAVEAHVSQTLGGILVSFFKDLVESLSRHANEASNNAESREFSEASASILQEWRSIKQYYQRMVTKDFQEFSGGAGAGVEDGEHRFNLSDAELALIPKKEFEDWLVLKVIISSAEREYSELLLELKLRLDAMLGAGVRAVSPVSPSSLVYNLQEIILRLNLPRTVQQKVYAEFDFVVMKNLSSLYREINSILKQQGVLPDLILHKSRPRPNSSRSNSTSNGSSDIAAELDNTEGQELPENFAGDQDSSSIVEEVQPSTVSNSATFNPKLAEPQTPLAHSTTANNTNTNTTTATTADPATLGLKTAGADFDRGNAAQLERSPVEAPCFSSDHLDDTLSPSERFLQASQRLLNNTNSILNKATDDRSAVPSVQAERKAAVEPEMVQRSLARLMETTKTDLTEFGEYVRTNKSKKVKKERGAEGSSDILKTYLKNLAHSTDEKSLVVGVNAGAVSTIDNLVDSMLDTLHMQGDMADYLNQLRILMLKAHLSDETFLSQADHPVNRLINKMAEIEDDEAELTNDVKAQLDQGFEKILNDDGVNVKEVEELSTKLDHCAVKQQKNFDQNVERLAQLYDGQEKLSAAKEKVAQELDNRFVGLSIPIVLQNLFDNGWRDLMRLALLRKGDDSEQWMMSLAVIDNLAYRLKLDCHTPKPGAEKGSVALEFSTLMNILRKGLERVGTLNTCQVTLKELEHYVAYEGSLIPNVKAYVPISLKAQDELEKNRKSKANEEESDQSLTRWTKRVEDMQAGDWFRFIEKPSIDSNGRRCCLAWISEDRSQFVFVNKRGVKYSDLNALEFAKNLSDGRIWLVEEEDDSFVDNGLNGMVQNMYERLAFESAHDNLTRLFNRAEFERQVDRALRTAKQYDKKHTLIYLDVSHFKVINVSAGIKAGDELLKRIAKILQKTAPKNAIVARMGGNEFGVLMPNYDAEMGKSIAETQLTAVKSIQFKWEDSVFCVGASIGLVEVNCSSGIVSDIFQQLNESCVKAKTSGGDRICTVEVEDIYEAEESQRTIIDWVAKANSTLEESSIRLRAQKIASISDSLHGPKLPAYEILLSALDADGNTISPLDLVRVAERFNRMQVVDQWIIRRVIAWMSANPDVLEKISHFSVNLSGLSFSDDRLADFILQELAEKNVPPEKICFEITETAAVENYADSVEFIRQLKSAGCRFALDDFGTGVSSFAYLKNLPVDIIKIDGTFVRHMAIDATDYAMIRSMDEMAHCMGKVTVAEQVADENTLLSLKAIGVDYVQGFYIEKPVWLDELTAEQITP